MSSSVNRSQRSTATVDAWKEMERNKKKNNVEEEEEEDDDEDEDEEEEEDEERTSGGGGEIYTSGKGHHSSLRGSTGSSSTGSGVSGSGGGGGGSGSSSSSKERYDKPHQKQKRTSDGTGGGGASSYHHVDDLIEGEEPCKAKNSNECNNSNNNSNSSTSGMSSNISIGNSGSIENNNQQDDASKNRKRRNSEVPEEKSPQNYPKKKKEYKAPSSFIVDDEFEDILERGWFYMDYNGDQQGPFTTKEMKEWFVAGFFNNEIMVKRITDREFQKISDKEEFQHLERKPSQQNYVPTATFEQIQSAEDMTHNPYYQDFPAVYDPSFDPITDAPPVESNSEDTTYSQAAFFTTLKGRFSVDQATHWKSKGLPMDKDGRMMSHYFDVEAYQEQMRNLGPPKKKKVTKNMIKFYKKRKEDRKRRRILML